MKRLLLTGGFAPRGLAGGAGTKGPDLRVTPREHWEAMRARERELQEQPGASRDAATILKRAEARWFNTALRARIDDCLRSLWKDRFVARAVLLITRWRRAR